MVSNRATRAFRGSPDRSQTYAPRVSRRNKEQTSHPTREGERARGRGRLQPSPEAKPSHFLLIFWWSCAKGEDAYVKRQPLKTLFPPSHSPFLPLFSSISISISPRQPSRTTMVLLVTSDNEQFVVDKEVAERSVLIKNMLEGERAPRCLCHPISDSLISRRCRRERPAHPIAECFFVCAEKSLSSSRRPRRSACPLIASIAQVLEYCEHHRGEPLPTADEANADENRKRTTDIGEWDQKFITVDQEMLFEIILAANYLDIKPLLCVVFRGLRNELGSLTLM